MTNTNNNNSKRNASSKYNIICKNGFRNSEINNVNMYYITLNVSYK